MESSHLADVVTKAGDQSLTLPKMQQLLELLEQAWCPMTSMERGSWSSENPSLGQCACTAMVVQDLMGGEIVRAMVDLPSGEICSHYWNRLPDGDVDLTRQQFPAEAHVRGCGEPRLGGEESTRAYLETNPDLVQRYRLLRRRVEEAALFCMLK